MRENSKKSKEKTKADKGTDRHRRQQKTSSPRRVPESSAARTRVSRGENKNPPRTKKSDNPRVALQNPRRIKPHSKLYQVLMALAFIIVGAVLFLMLFTFTQADLAEDAEEALNLFGIVGAHIANVMLTLFGLGAFYFSGMSLLVGICTLVGREYEVKASEIIGLCLLIAGSAPLFDMAFSGALVLDHQPGGVLGDWLADFAAARIPASATISICSAAGVFGLLLVTDTRLKSFLLGIWHVIRWIFVTIGGALILPFRRREAAAAEPECEEAALPDTEEPDKNKNVSAEYDDSLFYEDTPSQLLDGVSSDLEQREADALDVIEPEVQNEPDAAPDEREPGLSVFDDAPAEPVPEPAGVPAEETDESHDGESAEEENLSDVFDQSDDEIDESDEDAEAQEPDKQKSGEALGDIMARIRQSAPKSRSIRRSHSVPALEPEFEFDSILAPEQIVSGQIGTEADPVLSKQIAEPEPHSAILPNWKPRSIDRRAGVPSPVNHESQEEARKQAAAARDEAAEDLEKEVIGIPAPELPSHLTRDLLAQLSTGEIDMSADSAVTVRPFSGASVDVSAETEDIIAPKHFRAFDGTMAQTSGKGTDASTKAAVYPEKIFDDAASLMYPSDEKPKIERPKDADATPCYDGVDLDALLMQGKGRSSISQELSALMAEANPDFVIRDNPMAKKPALRSIHDMPRAASQVTRVRDDIVLDDDSDGDFAAHLENKKQHFDFESLKQSEKSRRHADAPKMTRDLETAAGDAKKSVDSFVVAEEKKRPSERELDDAEKNRQRNKSNYDYELPPLSLLHYNPASQKGFAHDELRDYAQKIKEKLEEYKVFGDVVNICPGPVVTRFEYLPAPGTKVAKIEGLFKDLMMALEIVSIRILAPIPGKNVVGIEIPNENRNIIYFKEVIASEQFQKAKSLLTIALGKDSEGEPVVADLAKMPHLLVAGTTGSGKSVGINTMLCSLLYNASPDDVKLILVDPKMLELSIYDGIPHLLVPPITTPHETAAALEWACDEMDERYRKLAAFGVRNIAGYNEQLQNPTLPSAIEGVRQLDENGEPVFKKMPYIVIVVDEFADLMMTAGKEIEKSIARLAQKARAAGIHIILATQRPSTNVITGVIKANFPTRLAFKVMTLTDSRVILDQRGAETLLGNGDSLYLAPNGELTRVHGAYVSDDEVQGIVQFLAKQREPEYNMDITTPKDDEGASSGSSAGSSGDHDKYDELYDEALRIVVESGQASASMLQRRLSIGFNRGARIIEQMERDGVIGPARGQKPREVLINKI